MATLRYLDSDVVGVFEMTADGKKGRNRLATLLWGDNVRWVRRTSFGHELEFTTRKWNDSARKYEWITQPAIVSRDVQFRDDPVLKIRFVDVGQGDAAIIETPGGQLILVDGGEENHLSNYVCSAWAHVLRTKQLRIAAILVSHGDADHFAGLPKLIAATRAKNTPAIVVDRVFHNGLVKAPSKDGTVTRKDKDMFGRTTTANGGTYITQLEDDLIAVDESRMNEPFKDWQKALESLHERNTDMTIQRLEYGEDAPFEFLENENIQIQVLGPITEMVRGKPALPFLHTPGTRSLSASHTINGHSVVLRLTYGNVRVLFGADLNEQSETSLLARCRTDGKSLASEVLKVPHHGSADFSPRILEAIQPVVSVISSGDENVQKEYIHPRAGLVGALGKYSRTTVEKPLIYVTEMVAFFRRLGAISAHQYGPDNRTEKPTGTHIQNAYEKTSFGIVHIRTDGKRVLVATHSGDAAKKESYVFEVDANGAITFADEASVL